MEHIYLHQVVKRSSILVTKYNVYAERTPAFISLSSFCNLLNRFDLKAWAHVQMPFDNTFTVSVYL
jgi:hypothetical protein